MKGIDVIKDTLCGTAAGVAQVLVLVPIQNVITKMINKPQQYSGFARTVIKTLKEEGPFSFFKGMLFPLVGVGAKVSVQFGVVETVKKVMKQRYADQHGKLPTPFIVLSGSVSGIPSGLIATPLDHARFRVLMNKNNDGPGSIKMAANIFKKYGITKLYLGMNITVLRQMIGLGIYFGSYDIIHRGLMNIFGLDILTAAFQAGGIAGVVTWASVYPMHYVKVRIQSDDLDNPKYKSATQCARQIIGKEFTKMYTGVGWFLIRAYLVNGATFIVFQRTKKLLYPQHKS